MMAETYQLIKFLVVFGLVVSIALCIMLKIEKIAWLLTGVLLVVLVLV